MSIPLHNTVMGQRLIEGTLPDIARELKNLNAHLNRIAKAFDKAPTPTAPPPQPEAAEADVIEALRAAKGELVGLIEERYGDPDKWPTVRKVRAVLDRLTAEQNDSDDIPDAAFLRHARRRRTEVSDSTIARAMADLARNRLTEVANANPEEEGREL